MVVCVKRYVLREAWDEASRHVDMLRQLWGPHFEYNGDLQWHTDKTNRVSNPSLHAQPSLCWYSTSPGRGARPCSSKNIDPLCSSLDIFKFSSRIWYQRQAPIHTPRPRYNTQQHTHTQVQQQDHAVPSHQDRPTHQ